MTAKLSITAMEKSTLKVTVSFFEGAAPVSLKSLTHSLLDESGNVVGGVSREAVPAGQLGHSVELLYKGTQLGRAVGNNNRSERRQIRLEGTYDDAEGNTDLPFNDLVEFDLMHIPGV